MSIYSRSLLCLSILLLGHSGFSSHEFHQLLKNTSPHLVSSASKNIPADIRYEAVTGLILFVLSVFLSFEKAAYYPLQGEQKLLKLNQYLADIDLSKANNVNNLTGKNPFGIVTCMPNFINVHEKRKQIAESITEDKKSK